MSAIVFDCDGVLADTERYGHRPAFNQAFREFGLPLQWSEEKYARKLQIAGGKERMASELTPEFVRANGLPADPEGRAGLLATWHERKTQIYIDMVASGKLPPRPGITRRSSLKPKTPAGSWRSRRRPQSSRFAAILERAVGSGRAAQVHALLAGDCVTHKKPAADIYLLAVKKLGVDPAEVLVIEDSRNGLEAACGAGLRCLVTVNGYTEHEDFSKAALVVSSLGDPGGEKTVVIANRSKAWPGDYVALADIEKCLAD